MPVEIRDPAALRADAFHQERPPGSGAAGPDALPFSTPPASGTPVIPIDSLPAHERPGEPLPEAPKVKDVAKTSPDGVTEAWDVPDEVIKAADIEGYEVTLDGQYYLVKPRCARRSEITRIWELSRVLYHETGVTPEEASPETEVYIAGLATLEVLEAKAPEWVKELWRESDTIAFQMAGWFSEHRKARFPDSPFAGFGDARPAGLAIRPVRRPAPAAKS